MATPLAGAGVDRGIEFKEEGVRKTRGLVGLSIRGLLAIVQEFFLQIIT
jgi:hypothetical protein